MTVWYAGLDGTWIELHPNLHTRRSPTQSDIHQMSYWYNWLSWWWAHGCSKHEENWKKHIRKKNCASGWLFTGIESMLHYSSTTRISFNLLCHLTNPLVEWIWMMKRVLSFLIVFLSFLFFSLSRFFFLQHLRHVGHLYFPPIRQGRFSRQEYRLVCPKSFKCYKNIFCGNIYISSLIPSFSRTFFLKLFP